jgi:Predicted enzyme with a TIM-barrel fold
MIKDNLSALIQSIPSTVTLVAVSKTKPVASLLEAHQAGQRDFGENKVQELVDKASVLPQNIRWHMIGHLQRNKVKYIAPFVSLIHSVDSFRLLKK